MKMIKNIFADKVIKLKKGAYHNLICPRFLNNSIFHVLTIPQNGNFLQLISEQNQLKSVKKTNEYTNQYGLSLSDCDVHELMNRRREALVRQQRIEFGGGILEIIHYC